MYTPKNLKKWTLPKYYYGQEWPNYFVFLARTRDSDNLENSNFEMGLKELGGKSESINIIEESHWACGWIQWIGIHESNDTALKLADNMKEKLNDYPLLDEEDYSNREYDDYIDNVNQAVTDYINDNDFDITDNQQKLIEHHIMQNSNDDSYPTKEDINSAYDEVITKHMKKCVNCQKYFNDNHPCDCQLKLF